MIGYELWAAIDTLKKRGWSNKAIARDLRIHVQTVRKYLRRRSWEPYRREKKPGRLLDPFILEVWGRIVRKYIRVGTSRIDPKITCLGRSE